MNTRKLWPWYSDMTALAGSFVLLFLTWLSWPRIWLCSFSLVRPYLHPRLLESKPLYLSSRFLFQFCVPSLKFQNIPPWSDLCVQGRAWMIIINRTLYLPSSQTRVVCNRLYSSYSYFRALQLRETACVSKKPLRQFGRQIGRQINRSIHERGGETWCVWLCVCVCVVKMGEDVIRTDNRWGRRRRAVVNKRTTSVAKFIYDGKLREN